MEIKIPELALVTLIGTSGSGKSTFAKKHFKSTEIVSSDFCRGLVSDDENNQAASKDAFDLVHYITAKRLKNGLLTVIDATNVQKEARKPILELAKQYHCIPVAIVLNLPEDICHERNEERDDRDFGKHVIRNQKRQLKNSLKWLKKGGFRYVYEFNSEEEINALLNINREPLYNNKKSEIGPFDIIGDIHGCYDELLLILGKLNYNINKVEDNGGNFGLSISHPENRKAVFLGDLVDRGPKSPEVLKLVMSMVSSNAALCVPGNHDTKLLKKLQGRKVQIRHGLAETIEQLSSESPEFIEKVKDFLHGLISHYVLDKGNLVVAHAGLKEEMQGRGSGAVRSFCLYGETTGETDEYGLPVRHNWSAEYRGKAKVVYGHTPSPNPQWLNNTICLDSGCVFGGELTALRYPEEELVSIKAAKVYAEPSKPLLNENQTNHQHENDEVLDIEDVTGKRFINTSLYKNITIRKENSIAALEVMSRFAINPKWLMYLPPTMSPCGTSEIEGYLEHPKQAIKYYAKRGVEKVVCEEKHMGSRAIIVVTKNNEVTLKRFGIEDDKIGICYTRTGRNFFNDPILEKAFLERVQLCLSNSGFWDKYNTDWVCLDCELMPWSAKAQGLLKDQYASVGAASTSALSKITDLFDKASNRNIEGLQELSEKFTTKAIKTSQYVDSYRQYCWEVNSLDDYKLAPFHILATEGKVYTDKPHEWHMDVIKELSKGDEKLFIATNYKIIDTQNTDSIDEAIIWWEGMTANGGEGMVVKPYNFLAYGKEGLLQPAIKCRGSEYLRIIYGPEYDVPENLNRLRKRGLSRKRSLAIREFTLGIEALERFVKKQPLRKTHECVFGVLALESEEVDPRL